MGDLVEAIAETGATLAFDAIGGGRLAGQILTAMELALTRTARSGRRTASSSCATGEAPPRRPLAARLRHATDTQGKQRARSDWDGDAL